MTSREIVSRLRGKRIPKAKGAPRDAPTEYEFPSVTNAVDACFALAALPRTEAFSRDLIVTVYRT